MTSPDFLVIQWEDMGGLPAPYSGAGLWGDTRVWFTATNLDTHNSATLEGIKYNIYELSPKSWNEVDSEHVRRNAEVGYMTDYGEKYNTDPPESVIVQEVCSTIFKLSYTFDDLESLLLTTIDYNQIKNPFPHIKL